MEKISVDKYTEIKNDFYRENFWVNMLLHKSMIGLSFILSMEDFLDHKS